ncbi:hypothetical protein [Corynebacterium ulcerans]|uniref:hypothetical protein n=1 Tax=Corynebacterium ulcerans TaxID=65058 RepID=UPI0018D5B15A|nr:hypothetical protein [Corynebacterium ulcerans]MBH5296213.1 hypothetical protein [Corynebacterium ulcerans]
MTSLADMTPAQRLGRVGMWCDYDVSDDEHGTGIICADETEYGFNELTFEIKDPRWVGLVDAPATAVIPRPDLPRAWTPQGNPVPGEWVHDQDEPGTYAPRNGARAYRRFVTDWEPA